MKYKRNLNETIHRNRKLWNRDYTDKVLAKIDIDNFSSFETWEKALEPGICPDYRKMFRVFTDGFENRKDLLDDATPTARPNIGDSAFGGYLGADLVFGEAGGWAKPLLPDLSDLSKLRFDPKNRWIKHLEEATRYFAVESEGICATSIIETMDSLNFAENIYGSGVFLELYDHPKELLRLFDFALEFNIKLIELQRKYIKKFEGGYFDLHEEWLPDDCVWLSIDGWGQCSPKMFRDLGKHHLKEIIGYFGSGWLHMHNSHLHLLEEVADINGLLGIGILDDPRQESCFGQLAKIQEKTKDMPLQISCGKEEFLLSLENGTLPRNVMYWIESGVKTVIEGNEIMEKVYNY
jgi:hypothetical protein